MKKFKTIILYALSLTLAVCAAVAGTVAYLTSEDNDVNVMTLGNVHIKQHEYERIENEDGTYEMFTSPNYGEGYKLQEFTQAKPLYPATGAIAGWGTIVPFDQIEGASGAQKVLAGLNNVQDKFVLVENTGISDAYVRQYIAFEYGSNVKEIVKISTGDFWTYEEVGIVEINGNNYSVLEAVYKGSSSRHVGGVLPAGEYTYSSLNQIYLKNEATNEDCVALDGNNNGVYDIIVLSQAVQAKGFEDAKTALDTAFGVSDKATVKAYLEAVGTLAVVNDQDELKDALNTQDSVLLMTDVNEKSGELMVKNGATFNGAGNKISFTSGNSNKTVLGTTGGTIENVKVEGNGKSVQGIGAGMTTANPLTKDLYINNVTVDGVMYAVIGTANNVKVIVNDSTLYGAFSYIGASLVEIHNSTLGAGKSMYDFFEVTSDTKFDHVKFEDGYCFMAYDEAAGSVIEFTNCTVNNVALTASNFKTLLVDTRWDYSSELSSTNLKDCTIKVDGVTVTW